jgi:hypothetical protein
LRHFCSHWVGITKDTGITRRHTISYKTTWVIALECYASLENFKTRENTIPTFNSICFILHLLFPPHF